MRRFWRGPATRSLLMALSFFIPWTNTGRADDQLTIISAHRKSIQTEYIPRFEKYYKEKFGTAITVEWIDQGGAENDLRFVTAKYANNPASSGIDLFWGGGDVTFAELEEKGLLEPFMLSSELDRELPKTAVGVALRSTKNMWYATAMSSFGIFYNKKLMTMLKHTEPTNWASLGDPSLVNTISVADPRRSSSALIMNLIILESLGWDRGWETLGQMAGNTKSFTQSSSDPIKEIVSGDAALATAIDFYAYAKIADLGPDKLGFILPAGETVFNPDPIGILKGAANKKEAERFVEYVLSVPGQKLLILPQGAPEGPTSSFLGRIAVSPKAYTETQGKLGVNIVNPFTMPTPKFKLDLVRISKMKSFVSDLIGAIHIDVHDDLKKAWRSMIKRGLRPDEMLTLTKPPLAEKDMWPMIEKWNDSVFRNKTINSWIEDAKARYAKLVAKNS